MKLVLNEQWLQVCSNRSRGGIVLHLFSLKKTDWNFWWVVVVRINWKKISLECGDDELLSKSWLKEDKRETDDPLVTLHISCSEKWDPSLMSLRCLPLFDVRMVDVTSKEGFANEMKGSSFQTRRFSSLWSHTWSMVSQRCVCQDYSWYNHDYSTWSIIIINDRVVNCDQGWVIDEIHNVRKSMIETETRWCLYPNRVNLIFRSDDACLSCSEKQTAQSLTVCPEWTNEKDARRMQAKSREHLDNEERVWRTVLTQLLPAKFLAWDSELRFWCMQSRLYIIMQVMHNAV